jgi:uncharacterized protein YyaL (SSP411 family)
MTSCKESKAPGRKVVVDPILSENRSADQIGAVYRAADQSPIHWQPWNDATMQRAKDAGRLVLVVIVLPQQSGYREILRHIEKDRNLVNVINSEYVPVLVNADAAREMGLLAAPLCAEIKQSLDLPVIMWITPEKNPVAWMPISVGKTEDATPIFSQSHQMVSRMWRDDPDYVLRNSRIDNEARRARMAEEKKYEQISSEPATDAAAGARQLISLYDPISRIMDETGGLFPAGIIDVVTAAAALPADNVGLKTRSARMTEDLLEDLLPSAMFDPLEGGVFSGRIAQSWALPGFTWNCSDQGRVATALFRAYQITGDPLALERALGLIRFSENRFVAENGLFTFGSILGGQPQSWLWTTEEIQQALPPEDARWWIAATGMKSLGNLPSEVDPSRLYFRKNSLSLPKPLSAVAAQLSVSPEEFQARFDASRKKLTEVRNRKLGPEINDQVSYAGSNFRMVSAYAAAYAATGDLTWRTKAVDLLGKSREEFFADGKLHVYSVSKGPEKFEARAFIYGLAVHAALDVADVTSDDQWFDWVEELCGTAEKLFKMDGGLMEVSKDAMLIDLPIVDRRRIFDDTTGGLFALAEIRLAPSGHPASAIATRLAPPLTSNAAVSPILYTDRIFAALVKHNGKTVIRGNGLSAEMKTAVERLPFQLVPRAGAKDSDGIPDGSVRVVSPDGSVKLISNPSELRKELLLSDKTS